MTLPERKNASKFMGEPLNKLLSRFIAKPKAPKLAQGYAEAREAAKKRK